MKPTLKSTRVWLPIGLAIAFILGMWTGRTTVSSDSYSRGNDKLNLIFQLIESQYVDEINIDSLIDVTIPDLLSHLDPHTIYIPAEDLQMTNDELNGSFSGIGISFQLINDTIAVVEIISGGPAEKAGLLTGDRIVAIDDTIVAGQKWSNDKILSTLRGPKGSEVKLGIKRPSDENLIDFVLVRDDIPVSSIDAAYRITDKIGYIRVNKFGAQTYSEFLQACENIDLTNNDKLIIDLRGNGGGYMDPAVLMANEFLHRGEIIVSTRGRMAAREEIIRADGSGSFPDVELVVLLDEYSASASEIFAGAIQDNDRGLIIGRRSFGKGLVQNQTVLPDNSALRLTVARYYTPSGRCIQKQYNPGHLDDYSHEIYDRYFSGEMLSADSIRLGSDIFFTASGRRVYGGGGIIPDIFVPNDTSKVTSYYLAVINAALPQKFALHYNDLYRQQLRGMTSADEVLRQLPDDQGLLQMFVNYCASEGGIPARWYYINISSDLIVNQLKALIVRDALNNAAFYETFNRSDEVVRRAVEELKAGNSVAPLKPKD